ncbi:hypothetical protein D4764_05G0012810 [Takifugu flavidus]|uniref:Uncharacterized protein n=1 Tax=Takifugu flavidus TaxID=433684 RepID=A0A5C6N4A4_9TELE|nr:hypothetical protein D4764_05G0012810 [Takifugu flavidus]
MPVGEVSGCKRGLRIPEGSSDSPRVTHRLSEGKSNRKGRLKKVPVQRGLKRGGKTIGVQMDASPLFLDDLPLPPSLRPISPSVPRTLGRRDAVAKRGAV